MQSQDFAQPGETPLSPPPSSPTLPPPFHRHHPQPTPTIEANETRPSLHQRHPSASQSLIRINIQTPFSDDNTSSSRRKEGWPVRCSMTMRELKDEIARGGVGVEDGWEKDGMRLVWQGRIVRDDERLSEIAGNTRDPAQVQTFHLVARRIQSGSQPIIASTARPAPEPIPALTPALLARSTDTLSTIALRDTIHYLLFTARHHIGYLISAPVLKWTDMVPPPIIEQGNAREAVMSVVRAYAEQRLDLNGSWRSWEGAFEGDDLAGLEEEWKRVGGRESVERELKEIWVSRVGRKWRDGDEGESVVVEMDDIDYQLHLPPLHFMMPAQLTHFLIYLRITSLLPSLNQILEIDSHPPPTPTIPAAIPATRVIYHRTFRIRLPRIPVPVLQHIFFSGLKIVAMMWMLTRDMKWDNINLWILGGGAVGWWFGDALNRYNQERRRNLPAAPPPAAEDGPGNANIGGDVPNQPAPAAAQAGVGLRARRPRSPTANRLLTALIPLIHLDTDAAQLRLPGSSTQQAATGDPDPARPPTMPRQPPRWRTQILLPILLWVLTLVPEFEAIRSRAIRRRERAMRVYVGELSATSISDIDPTTEEGGEIQRVFPRGLNRVAKAYYERVMERGEGIDWEEEREAQRALGVVDGEAEREGGLGLGMI